MTASLESPWDAELLDQVRSLQAGSTRVVDAQLERRDESGARYFLLVISLSAPRGETWPSDDFYEIRRAARTLASRFAGDDDVQLSYRTEGSDSAADAEQPAEVGSSRDPAEGVR